MVRRRRLGEGLDRLRSNARFAQARGATPCPTHGSDRRFSPPKSSGIVDAINDSIRSALRAAQVGPGDIGHLNANGLSTCAEDAYEAQAIRQAVGDAAVFAPKSYFGNLGPGTSIVELIASICAMQNRMLPATLNFDAPDPNCPINVVNKTTSLPEHAPTALLSLATTGQIATIVAV
jgi:3-oxoacyl-[acyl-carrier-protein] synthase II